MTYGPGPDAARKEIVARGDQTIKYLKNLPDIAPIAYDWLGLNEAAARRNTALRNETLQAVMSDPQWLAAARAGYSGLRSIPPWAPED